MWRWLKQKTSKRSDSAVTVTTDGRTVFDSTRVATDPQVRKFLDRAEHYMSRQRGPQSPTEVIAR